MKRYYGAYGSNLNIEQMKRRCPDSKIIGKSILKDYRLMFKGSDDEFFLTVEEEKGCEVPLGIWEVSESDELSLDVYEAYPDLYYKKEFELDLNGKKESIFIYIMYENKDLGAPSSKYLITCLKGYENFDFDEKIMYEALNYSSKDKNQKY